MYSIEHAASGSVPLDPLTASTVEPLESQYNPEFTFYFRLLHYGLQGIGFCKRHQNWATCLSSLRVAESGAQISVVDTL